MLISNCSVLSLGSLSPVAVAQSPRWLPGPEAVLRLGNTQSDGLLRPRLGGESVCSGSGSGSAPWRAPEQKSHNLL